MVSTKKTKKKISSIFNKKSSKAAQTILEEANTVEEATNKSTDPKSSDHYENKEETKSFVSILVAVAKETREEVVQLKPKKKKKKKKLKSSEGGGVEEAATPKDDAEDRDAAEEHSADEKSKDEEGKDDEPAEEEAKEAEPASNKTEDIVEEKPAQEEPKPVESRTVEVEEKQLFATKESTEVQVETTSTVLIEDKAAADNEEEAPATVVEITKSEEKATEVIKNEEEVSAPAWLRLDENAVINEDVPVQENIEDNTTSPSLMATGVTAFADVISDPLGAFEEGAEPVAVARDKPEETNTKDKAEAKSAVDTTIEVVVKESSSTGTEKSAEEVKATGIEEKTGDNAFNWQKDCFADKCTLQDVQEFGVTAAASTAACLAPITGKATGIEEKTGDNAFNWQKDCFADKCTLQDVQEFGVTAAASTAACLAPITGLFSDLSPSADTATKEAVPAAKGKEVEAPKDKQENEGTSERELAAKEPKSYAAKEHASNKKSEEETEETEPVAAKEELKPVITTEGEPAATKEPEPVAEPASEKSTDEASLISTNKSEEESTKKGAHNEGEIEAEKEPSTASARVTAAARFQARARNKGPDRVCTLEHVAVEPKIKEKRRTATSRAPPIAGLIRSSFSSAEEKNVESYAAVAVTEAEDSNANEPKSKKELKPASEDNVPKPETVAVEEKPLNATNEEQSKTEKSSDEAEATGIEEKTQEKAKVYEDEAEPVVVATDKSDDIKTVPEAETAPNVDLIGNDPSDTEKSSEVEEAKAVAAAKEKSSADQTDCNFAQQSVDCNIPEAEAEEVGDPNNKTEKNESENTREREAAEEPAAAEAETEKNKAEPADQEGTIDDESTDLEKQIGTSKEDTNNDGLQDGEEDVGTNRVESNAEEVEEEDVGTNTEGDEANDEDEVTSRPSPTVPDEVPIADSDEKSISDAHDIAAKTDLNDADSSPGSFADDYQDGQKDDGMSEATGAGPKVDSENNMQEQATTDNDTEKASEEEESSPVDTAPSETIPEGLVLDVGGAFDLKEAAAGADPEMAKKTSQAFANEDGDSLSYAAEKALLGTFADKADTDLDCAGDKEEQAVGADPADGTCPPEDQKNANCDRLTDANVAKESSAAREDDPSNTQSSSEEEPEPDVVATEKSDDIMAVAEAETAPNSTTVVLIGNDPTDTEKLSEVEEAKAVAAAKEKSSADQTDCNFAQQSVDCNIPEAEDEEGEVPKENTLEREAAKESAAVEAETDKDKDEPATKEETNTDESTEVGRFKENNQEKEIESNLPHQKDADKDYGEKEEDTGKDRVESNTEEDGTNHEDEFVAGPSRNVLDGAPIADSDVDSVSVAHDIAAKTDLNDADNSPGRMADNSQDGQKEHEMPESTGAAPKVDSEDNMQEEDTTDMDMKKASAEEESCPKDTAPNETIPEGLASDGNGVINLEEVAAGTDPVKDTKTSQALADEDSNGLSDAAENSLGTLLDKADTDLDCAGDKEEQAVVTDPDDGQTGDLKNAHGDRRHTGATEAEEYSAGADPVNPQDKPSSVANGDLDGLSDAVNEPEYIAELEPIIKETETEEKDAEPAAKTATEKSTGTEEAIIAASTNKVEEDSTEEDPHKEQELEAAKETSTARVRVSAAARIRARARSRGRDRGCSLEPVAEEPEAQKKRTKRRKANAKDAKKNEESPSPTDEDEDYDRKYHWKIDCAGQNIWTLQFGAALAAASVDALTKMVGNSFPGSSADEEAVADTKEVNQEDKKEEESSEE